MTEDHAKYCIAQLELIRTALYNLAKTTNPLSPKTALTLCRYADEMKDLREVLEEHITEDYDIGK